MSSSIHTVLLKGPAANSSSVRSTVHRPDSRGFTLVELMVVVTLGIVLMAMAIGASIQASAVIRLRTSAGALATNLSQARSEALKRARPVWVQLDAVNGTIQLQTQVGAAVQPIGTLDRLASGVTFIGFAGTRQVMFDSIGRPTVPPQSVLIGRGRTTSTVTVSATGRVTTS